MREWILKSLEFAIVTRLVELDPNQGTLIPVLKEESKSSEKLALAFKADEGMKAENLGRIFARTNESEIAYYLGVKF